MSKQPILRIGAVLLLALSLFTCNEEEFLDRVPNGRFTPESFYLNGEQINDATTTLYPLMRSMASGALNDYGDYRSDNTTFEFNSNDRGREGFERVDYFLLQSGDGYHNQFYNPPYTGIGRANYILEAVDDVPFIDESRRATAKAEALFFRGYFHFLLIQHFGDVISSTEVVDGDGSGLAAARREPLEDVYQNVVLPDLRAAIEGLPERWDNNNLGRVDKATAQMALATTHFHFRDYASALPLLDSIVESGNYQLMDNFRDVFFTEQIENTEVIWAAQHSAAVDQGSTWMFDWVAQSGTDISMGRQRAGAGFNIPTCSLLDAFEEGDLRRDATLGIYDSDPDDPENETVPYSTKFLTIPFPEQGGTDVDYPIFRYADVLLMQAEALVETQGGLPNQALTNVNLIRARAGLDLFFPGNPNPDLDIRTPEQLRAAIRQERRVELAYEGKRSYDLRRYGTFVETMRAHGEIQKMKQPFVADVNGAYENIRELLAIPNGQILLYGYRQNEGW
ncbi:RagB/SusD family nutrient uptake outer membrane protein [Lewinella sp. 4G2]|uniref:RagB/SusD family nutrient uptake outer membrane protein n=1 Tax=Lewinella sp. 4G2 TaxID=1803372 RepID=UPI0007B4C656|nr:RagB/SusD family nutrient uptake outer membrane protein [Lewinella sp. 4G2]OAV44649.1 hypothetical protein A3850_009160 [Lewinella sp. 4G2]